MLAATTHPFIQSLEHIAGFILVLIALGMLWALTLLIGQFFKAREAGVAVTVQKAPPILGEGEPSEEEVVAISACVALIAGRRSRVVSIRSSARDWNREGRREHFASHKIR
jgi:hypothetical protein